MEKQPTFKIFVREYCKRNSIPLSKLILDRKFATKIRKIYNTTYGITVKEIA
jgi:hypothetical protein